MRAAIVASALVLTLAGYSSLTAAQTTANALLAIDQHRASVVERIVATWGVPLAKSSAYVSVDELRTRLLSLRADQLLAAGLAGTLEDVRAVIGADIPPPTKPGLEQTKALGDSAADVVYTPITPCRLVETRGTFAAVYQGNGTPAHTPVPFTPNQIRSYVVQGGNGVCLTQLPGGLNAAAVQLQVFGLPTTTASGDIEILPQGATFGSTATMVYIGTIAFNTVSTTAKINQANNQISVQVRGGGANLAMDVVGYFAAPSGNGGEFFRQGGNAFGTTATLGTVDNQPLTLLVANAPALRLAAVSGGGDTDAVNVTNGSPLNAIDAGVVAGTIAGGGSMTAGTPAGNHVTGSYGTIGGGMGNTAGEDGTIGGGLSNTAGLLDTVAGGIGNIAAGSYSTVGGGLDNQASGGESVVGGGANNAATGLLSTVSGGFANTASGLASAVSGGESNAASGQHSLGAGFHANADGDGCFVFSDSSSSNPTSCFSPNVFVVRSLNGFFFYTNGSSDATYTGAQLVHGSSAWSTLSDRDSKENIETVHPHAVLEKLVAMPIATWNWKAQDSDIRHMGPMAQDFRAAFGLGEDDKHITTIDAEGIALAAIQGLNAKVEEDEAAVRKEIQAKEAEIGTLKQELAELRERGATQERALAELRRAVKLLMASTSAEGRVEQAR